MEHVLKSFIEIKKNLKQDYSQFSRIKIVVMGDYPTQFITQGIKAIGYEYKLDFEILEIDYNLIEQIVFNTSSNFYTFKPSFVIILRSSNKLLNKFNDLIDRSQLSQSILLNIQSIYEKINENLKTEILINNFNEINDFVYGNYANKIVDSFIYQVRKINYKLMDLCIEKKNLHIIDLSTIQNIYGQKIIFNPTKYITSELNFELDSTVIIAKNIVDIINAQNGGSKKCIIIDLDNTIWGGLIGDDGIENIELGNLGVGKAFTEFQHWLKKLNERGIILAVCSKNDEEIAINVFNNHPDMVLKKEHIAIFKINWNPKYKNIEEIQKILNISFDSMVYFDDSKFERESIKRYLPEIIVPDLPDDPAEYLNYLSCLNLFEIGSYSNEDINRTKFYHKKIKAIENALEFKNEDDYLVSLNMKCKVNSFNVFNLPRIVQLSQRSNQFNFRTIRYTENDIKNIMDDKSFHGFTFSLSDKFGDNGLVSVIVLKEINNHEFFIENWFMSCRVLKRGLESFILNHIITFAKSKGIKIIIGEYLSNPKNVILKDFFKENGFLFTNNRWELKVSETIKVDFIEPIEY